MRKTFAACALIILFAACKGNHASLSGSEKVEPADFFGAFAAKRSSFKIYDTNYVKLADTTTISYFVFTEFVPDSAVKNSLGKNVKDVKIHPVAKIEEEKNIYLLANFTANKKTRMFVFVFDKKYKYLASLELMSPKNDNYNHTVTITDEPTFIIGRDKTTATGELIYTRNGFGFNNSSGTFINVMGDSNEDVKKNAEIINPIDTLSRKNKYSGDYVQDKRNFIAVRDGKDAMHYNFFVHFEKDDGNCTGELKGSMVMRDNENAYYRENGDPCVIDFVFSGNNLSVKEEGNCGNHRGIKCYFNDTYHKKKEPKTSKKK